MARIFFIDKFIRSQGGHNLETNLRLVDVFGDAGVDTIIIGNSRFKGERPKNFHADLNFDYYRIVLKDDRKRLAEIREARQKLRRHIQFWEGLRSMPLGKALVQLNEIKAGRDTIDKEVKQPLWLGLLLFARLFGILLITFALTVTWPLRYVLFHLYRLAIKRASSKAFGFVKGRTAKLKNRITSIGELRLLYIMLVRNASKRRDEKAYESSVIRSLSGFNLKPDDIVFFSTATVGELGSVARILQRAPKLSAASWHFLFREPIFPAKGAAFVVQSNLRPLRSAIMEVTRYAPNLAFWCDTIELADQYSYLGIGRFGALPIALPELPAEAIGKPVTTARENLTIGYLGDARPEKGYGVLPPLIKKLAWKALPWLESISRRREIVQRDYALAYASEANTIRSRFMNARHIRRHMRTVPREDSYISALYQQSPSYGGLIQSNFNVEGGTSETRAARYRLMAQDDLGVKVVFKPFASKAYTEALLSSDIFVLYYTSWLYSAGSSGIFAEALAAGKPMIVSDATWGGRILRTRPEYVSHFKALMQDRVITSSDVTSNELVLGRTFWKLVPKSATHVIFMASVDAPDVFDQVELSFEFRRDDGALPSVVRRVCDRGIGAAGMVRVPMDARLMRVTIERLDARILPKDIKITLGHIDGTAHANVPFSAVGRVVADESELLEAALDIGAHYGHYVQTAAQVSAHWRADNNSAKFAQTVISATKKDSDAKHDI